MEDCGHDCGYKFVYKCDVCGGLGCHKVMIECHKGKSPVMVCMDCCIECGIRRCRYSKPTKLARFLDEVRDKEKCRV